MKIAIDGNWRKEVKRRGNCMLHTGGWTTMTDQRILKRQKREREETKGVYKDTGKAEHRRIQRERGI